jgi:OHCU decarboxylase
MHTPPPLNAMSSARFVEALDGLYERSPWVAERAHRAEGFADATALRAALREAVDSAPREDQRALLCAHPELGARSAALAHLTAESRSEQAGAGLTSSGEALLAEIASLNAAYRARHGFPFIVAVRGLSVAEIIAAMRARLERATEVEHAEALAQVHRIAGFRFVDRFGA